MFFIKQRLLFLHNIEINDQIPVFESYLYFKRYFLNTVRPVIMS